MAPEVGLEPTTERLTAVCSTIELLRNKPWTVETMELGSCRQSGIFGFSVSFVRGGRVADRRAFLAFGVDVDMRWLSA